ncbi:MAG: Ig-like domain-containing protein [Tannerella sp.]|nr:Ig-like domain-containing protein [Tannerella sp.]
MFVALGFIACNNDNDDAGLPKDVQAIEFVGVPVNDTIKLNKSETYQMNTQITPTDGAVKYISSNSRIFDVDKDGLITAMGGGVAQLIVVGANGDSFIKKSINVDVTELVEEIVVLTATNQMQILNRNANRTISTYFTCFPLFATNKTLFYKSSNTSIVTVNQSGRVDYVGDGIAEITVTSTDGGNVTSVPITFYSGYARTALAKTGGVNAWSATANSTHGGNPNSGGYRTSYAYSTSTSQQWNPSWDNNIPYPLYYQINLGSARAFNEIEINRRTTNGPKDIELYYIPGDVFSGTGLTVPDETAVGYSNPKYELDPRYVKWGEISYEAAATSATTTKQFVSFPETNVTARYVMLKITSGFGPTGDVGIRGLNIYNTAPQ